MAYKNSRKLSRSQLIIFALVFAAVGGVLLYKSFAANPNLPGDVNNDNVVNVTDLSILLSNYNQAYAPADFNSDGTVSILDLSILLSNYGKTYTPPGGGTADYFVSTTGNDSNSCTQAAPCRTLQRAASVAASGSVIEVAAGSYPGQEIRDIHKTLTIRSAAGAQPSSPSGQLSFFCVTGITIDNFDSKQMHIGPGSKNLTVKNSEFGGGTWTTGVEADPVTISGDKLNGSCAANGYENQNITLDNIRIHDYFWQQNPGPGPHPDCMQFYGGTNGFILKNSIIERCAESFIGAYPDFGSLRNITIQDSVFRDISEVGKGTYFAVQIGCNPENNSFQGVGDGFTIRGNTWTPNALGLEGSGISVRTDCQNFLVENNTFQYGPGQWACDYWNSSWNDTVVWRNNTFQNGGGCST